MTADDVGHLNRTARIVEGAGEMRGHRPALPRDDRGDQLGDRDGRRRRGRVQRGAQREAHAEAADQDAGAAPGETRAGESSERLLGPAEAAVHQLVMIEPDREFPPRCISRSVSLPPGTSALSIRVHRNLMTAIFLEC